MARVRARWTLAPPSIERYNGVPASPITGEAAPSLSSGDAMATMERLVREELPRGIGFEWSGQSLQEILSGQQAPMLLAVSLVVVPVGVLGALLFTSMRGLPAVVQADRDDFRGVHPRGVATGHFDGRRG
jgi:multidrug efflux pump